MRIGGNVGQSLARLLQRKAPSLAADYNLTFTITAIGTARHGMATDPQGLDIEHALHLASMGESLARLTAHPAPSDASSCCASAWQMYSSRTHR